MSSSKHTAAVTRQKMWQLHGLAWLWWVFEWCGTFCRRHANAIEWTKDNCVYQHKVLAKAMDSNGQQWLQHAHKACVARTVERRLLLPLLRCCHCAVHFSTLSSIQLKFNFKSKMSLPTDCILIVGTLSVSCLCGLRLARIRYSDNSPQMWQLLSYFDSSLDTRLGR